MDKAEEARRLADRIAIDDRIAAVRANIAQLTEQAAGMSGGATEELIASRIEHQEEMLANLLAERARLE